MTSSLGVDWGNHTRRGVRLYVWMGVLMRNRYLDQPSKLQLALAVFIIVTILCFLYVFVKILIGVILCLIQLL